MARNTVSARDDPWGRAWPAPAKLNLFLHVLGRRPDGYHRLQTVFRLIDFADTLRCAPGAGGEVRRANDVPGVPEAGDLAVRAAKLLQAETGCREGVTLTVEKRIPIGGGLGGGSSDAATVLAVLNHLWRLQLPRARLAQLALSLGADVPFFLFGGNAFAEGVGEILAPIALPPAWYVVLTPPASVSTRDIFAAPELTRDTKPIKMQAFFSGFGRNDLEPVVAARVPEVARQLAWLRTQGDARMSGSGASLFAEFATEREARSVLERVPADMHGFLARGLERHPLAELLDEPVPLGSRQVG